MENMKPCPDCHTHSINPLDPIGDGKCASCYGSGYWGPWAEELSNFCSDCKGSGKCSTCRGRGKIKGRDSRYDDKPSSNFNERKVSGSSSQFTDSYTPASGSSGDGIPCGCITLIPILVVAFLFYMRFIVKDNVAISVIRDKDLGDPAFQCAIAILVVPGIVWLLYLFIRMIKS